MILKVLTNGACDDGSNKELLPHDGRRYYTAAVVEYQPDSLDSESPTNILLRNAEKYVKIMETAATQVIGQNRLKHLLGVCS